jgi:hypothetical protein
MSTLDSGPSINRTATSSDEKTKFKSEEQHLEETFPKTARPLAEGQYTELCVKAESGILNW